MPTFLRQPWHIAGFARQGCRTNWLFGIDGGNQKERHFSIFFSCSDERIRDLRFSIEMVLFFHKSCDLCCLLCSFLLLNKKYLHCGKRFKIYSVMFGLISGGVVLCIFTRFFLHFPHIPCEKFWFHQISIHNPYSEIIFWINIPIPISFKGKVTNQKRRLC